MQDNKNPKKSQGLVKYIAILAVLIVGLVAVNTCSKTTPTYSRTQFIEDIRSGTVRTVFVHPNRENAAGYLEVILTDDSRQNIYAADISKLEEAARAAGAEPMVLPVEDEPRFLSFIIPVLIVCVAVVLVALIVHGPTAQYGPDPDPTDFTKSGARLVEGDDENRTKLDDVAGLHEEKDELQQIISFLQDPERFIALGARIPKGVLLEGPPGTGKTLLARAVAGEAGVPFYSISGSDFVEMFVGVGASRVRDLFADAKNNSPCIVFIDEIDAVGRRRGSGMGGGHDEREQTLNQLLVEMDGFGPNEGIIVMAATNRLDILDPAILRPGRFDRKITVEPPDVRARAEILQVHARNKPIGEDVSIEEIARTTAGFTGADLENLLNEAAISVAMDKREYITKADLDSAFVKVGIGTEKRSHVITKKEKLITAYHESGHAILFHELPDVGPVYTVSIIPTSGAAGYTMPLPERDEMFMTRGRMMQDITVLLGGRVAEELVFDDITTGASNDIMKATKEARKMVTKYGMSADIGTVCYDEDEDEVFLGRDLAHTRTHSEAVASAIDGEIKAIIDECYARARSVISEHRDVLEASARLLIEREKITQEEFESLW